MKQLLTLFIGIAIIYSCNTGHSVRYEAKIIYADSIHTINIDTLSFSNHYDTSNTVKLMSVGDQGKNIMDVKAYMEGDYQFFVEKNMKEMAVQMVDEQLKEKGMNTDLLPPQDPHSPVSFVVLKYTGKDTTVVSFDKQTLNLIDLETGEYARIITEKIFNDLKNRIK